MRGIRDGDDDVVMMVLPRSLNGAGRSASFLPASAHAEWMQSICVSGALLLAPRATRRWDIAYSSRSSIGTYGISSHHGVLEAFQVLSQRWHAAELICSAKLRAELSPPVLPHNIRLYTRVLPNEDRDERGHVQCTRHSDRC